ncbi:MAG: NUDIX domain-containing protein [Rhodomicrobium sp.]|nr:NUDIX domain-containing protein [Rhodomicrobium sp.]
MKKKLIQRALFPYWRLTRGMTFGVQGAIVRGGSEVLLIRHGYRPGWHFPGGGVEWGETLLTALAREVEEETGVVVQGEPRLHGVFANFQTAPSDHVAVYVVEAWQQPRVPEPTFEIEEHRFFPVSALPDEIARGTRARIAEIFEGEALSEHW